MRNLYELLETMINEIPPSAGLVRGWLRKEQENTLYIAPELLPEQWKKIEHFLHQIIFDSKTIGEHVNLGKKPGTIKDYEIKLLALWSDQDIELIRKNIKTEYWM